MCGSLLAPATLMAQGDNDAKKPNIIFILSDDAGYDDFGFQGSEQFRTPNLDKLASEGVILEQAYTTDAVSGPSRAGLMTGRYQQRFGIEENAVKSLMSDNSKYKSYDMGVATDEKMIPDYLSGAGYKCAIFGKWHLGSTDEFHPFKRGFDHFVGFRSGGRSFYTLTEKEMNESEDTHMEYGFKKYKEPAKGEYVTDILADAACDFIDKNNSKDPFFIYLAFNAVHAPLHIDPKDKEEFANIKDPNRRKLAAMALSMDRGIGRVMEMLKSKGLDKNTIIVFSNDNGGPNGTHTSNYPLRGMKATFLEGGIRVPAFVWYPGVVEAGTRYDKPISFLDFLPTFAKLADAPTPEGAKELDGVDIMPYITGKNDGRPHQTLYWKCENRGVVRDGDWKFMRFPDRPAELYDISNDIGEKNNLAAIHPELMEKYYKMLFDWEMTLERPKWMLDRFCEERVMNQFYEQEEYMNPVKQR